MLAACVSLSITHIAGSSFSGLTLPRSVYITSCLLLAICAVQPLFVQVVRRRKDHTQEYAQKKDDAKHHDYRSRGSRQHAHPGDQNSVNLRSSRIVVRHRRRRAKDRPVYSGRSHSRQQGLYKKQPRNTTSTRLYTLYLRRALRTRDYTRQVQPDGVRASHAPRRVSAHQRPGKAWQP